MKRGKFIFGAFVVAAWLAGGAAVIAQQGDSQTLTGVISNTHCGLRHSTADPSQAGCVNACVTGQGASYALVSGGKVYKLEGMTDQVSKLAGQSAKITGHLDGTNIRVEKVEAGS